MKTALALSLYSNGARVLDVSMKREGNLGAIHGIRFISMTWVMLGHVYVFGASCFSKSSTVGQWVSIRTLDCRSR